MTAPLHGPLEWRRIVQWLREDGVIAVEEAQRTVARLAQAESSQPRTTGLHRDFIGNNKA